MLYNQKDWKKFLDDYKELLVKTDNMLAESRKNYRVKKLAVFYGLRDRNTFEEYLDKELGRKYLGIVKYVLQTISAHSIYGYKANHEVAEFLLDKYFSNSNIEKTSESDLIEGYYKFLSDFTRELIREERDKEIEIDLDKLKIE